MALLTAVILLLFCGAAVKLRGNSKVKALTQSVSVLVGQDAILLCYVEPPSDVTTLTVEWRFNTKPVHVYRNKGDDPTLQDKDFKGRTSLFHNEMSKGNISLKLSSVNKGDAGIYTCCVPNLSSQDKKGNIVLTVEDQLSLTTVSVSHTPDKEEKAKNNQQFGLALGIPVTIIVILSLTVIVLRKNENQISKMKKSVALGANQDVRSLDSCTYPVVNPPSEKT